MVILSKKVRLRPTIEQEDQLWKSTSTARWAYNWAIFRQKDNYSKGGKFISDSVLRKELTQLKKTKEYSWLYGVSNNVTKQAIKDACIAYNNFFSGRTNLPKFKNKKESRPSFYNDNGKLKVLNNTVLIAKVGWVKTSEKLPKDCKYYNPRISFDGKYWFISVGIEQEIESVELTDKVIGIDVGIKELAICSDGKVFNNINKTKKIKNIEKRLHRLQRQLSRKYKMNKTNKGFVKTKNIIKLEKQIRNSYRLLSGIRNNHIHQATNAIVKTKPSKVVVETLSITNMMKNKKLSKAIQQQRLYDFKIKLKYKCEKYGIKFIEADMWFPSSKMCSNCGCIKSDLKLSDRVYICDCGLKIDRDMNAAINLSKYKS